MKKLGSFIFYALFSICMLSCTNEIVTDNVGSSLNQEDVNKAFLASVDSLNLAFDSISTNSRANELNNADFLKPYVNNSTSVVLADAAGAIAGKIWGPKVGALIGSTTGNPWGTIAGGLIGRRYGSAIFSTVCSFVAERCSASSNDDKGLKITEAPTVFVPNQKEFLTLEDSLGYLHNQVMFIMSNNNKSYKLSNNAINYNLIYDDCVENLKQLGYYDSQLSSDSEFRHYVTSRAESIAKLTKSCYWGRVSANEMLDCCNYIVKQIPGNNTQETDICFDVVKKVIVANRRKSIEDMRNYATELSKLIQDSRLSSSTKDNVSTAATITLNSSICWKHLEK